jgi:hypothetical protein
VFRASVERDYAGVIDRHRENIPGAEQLRRGCLADADYA